MNHKTDFFKVFLPLFNFLKNYSALAGVSAPRLIDASEIASSPWAFFLGGGGARRRRKFKINFCDNSYGTEQRNIGALVPIALNLRFAYWALYRRKICLENYI